MYILSSLARRIAASSRTLSSSSSRAALIGRGPTLATTKRLAPGAATAATTASVLALSINPALQQEQRQREAGTGGGGGCRRAKMMGIVEDVATMEREIAKLGKSVAKRGRLVQGIDDAIRSLEARIAALESSSSSSSSSACHGGHGNGHCGDDEGEGQANHDRQQLRAMRWELAHLRAQRKMHTRFLAKDRAALAEWKAELQAKKAMLVEE